HTAMDYLPGIRLADWVGLDYYPVKAGTPGGPEDALADAHAYYVSLGNNPDFALAEYCLNNDPAAGGVNNWSESDKVEFIETTYDLIRTTYPMISNIHWWFIGRGPVNSRINFQ
ncbi:MAG: hypothetical protein JW874_05790, partial [Spirochaetales bacterium]|nr:hypothetical protein [Spirochaetales bacterium]